MNAYHMRSIVDPRISHLANLLVYPNQPPKHEFYHIVFVTDNCLASSEPVPLANSAPCLPHTINAWSRDLYDGEGRLGRHLL